MPYSLRVSAKAETDFINALNYYDSINTALGDRFYDELLAVYSKITVNPQFYSFISLLAEDKFRDVKLSSFPFVVIYEIDNADVIVISVMNTNRRPV